MAKTNVVSTYCLIYMLNFVTASKYFCEFDVCNTDQYCCGDDICCNKPLDLWFLWLGIVLVCFALTIAAIIKCIRRKRSTVNVYDKVPMNEEF